MTDSLLTRLASETLTAEATRREALLTTGKLGLGAALAALPFFTAKPAAAQSTAGDAGILNYALTLEYLERAFYRRGVANGVAPPANAALFNQIRNDEEAHVALLSGAITQAGGTPVVYEDADFTFNVGGTDATTNQALFLTLAQGLEDTGVRAYKGRAAEIVNKAFLTVALQIHSVEARHAAALRVINGMPGWVSGDEATAAGPIRPVYGAGAPVGTFPAEGNTSQGGVALTASALGLSAGVSGQTISQTDIAEAFDEGLDANTVLSIATQFITGMEGN
ncbi:MAG TPA: ferritin-like domain-containing protein [Rubricoccaceae bacterium]